MLLIIGLGNYPAKYKDTRHNFGFLAIEALVKKFGFSDWRFERKFFAELSIGEIKGQKVIACKPQTLMNLSGKSVQALTNFYKIPAENCIILSDDLDLPFGISRFREKGSAGGQKGLKDVLNVLGTLDVRRVKFGIDAPHRSQMPTDKFVLSKFLPEEKAKIPQITKAGIEKLLSAL